MRGRKPVPKSIRQLEGDVSHRPLPNCPTPQPRLPKPPKELSKPARKIWKRLGAQLQTLNLVAEIDEAALAILCQAYATWLELIALAAKDGPIVRVNNQPVPNPYAVRADKSAEIVRRMLAEFGGSPASRTRLASPATSMPAEAETIEAFLRIAK